MKPFLLVLLLLLGHWASGQLHIDFDYQRDYQRLLEQSKIDSSAFAYSRLFPRFQAADTTLTNMEMIALQIGYTDNEHYWPYQDMELENAIWDLNEQGKFAEALQKCDSLLDNNPFSLLANREKGFALDQLGRSDEAQPYFDRFDLVAMSDLASGDGQSMESSWFALSPADGQWIIRLAFHRKICFMGSGSDANGNFHDILGIAWDDDPESCQHLYFNIEHAVKRMFGPDGLKALEENLKDNPKKSKKKKHNN